MLLALRLTLLTLLTLSWRDSSALRAAEPTPAPLTTAAAVRALSAAAAAESRPVALEGVVIALVQGPALVLWDDTDGIYITGPSARLGNLLPGDWVAVEGVTGPGNFAPLVTAAHIRRIGTKPLPPPTRTTVTDVAGGGFDAKWVEIEGIVRDCVNARTDPSGIEDLGSPAPARSSAPMSSFLTLASGEVQLRLKVNGVLDPATIIDAHVRFRGVCFNVHNANRQFVRASLFVPRLADVVVLNPPAPDPFALPLKRAGELLQFEPSGFSGHRVHVRGVVTRHQAGNALWIRDGDRGLQVVSAQAGEVAPGDEVDIAGFVEKGKYSPSLVDAIFRRRASGAPPTPIALTRFADAIAHEANLVRIDALLQETRATPEGLVLTLEWDDSKLQALMPKSAAAAAAAWEPGSLVRLTGICTLAPRLMAPNSGLWAASGFQLLLRDASDVTVLAAAPWLNPRRLTFLLGATAVLLVAVLVVLWLHSRRQIAAREVERRMAEAEFAAILGERNRVARDIHDTLAQGLNAVSMQLELAKNVSAKGSDAVLPHVATAHTIVRSCIAEARESIWNMRSHVLEKTDLAGALGGVLQQMSEGLPIDSKLEVTGSSRRLAPQLENDLLRIGQEGISNALKHAAASHLVVRLEFEPDCVRLRITDDGRGFDVAGARHATSRFGLKGIRERVAHLGGTLHLERGPGGRGTELRVEVAAPLESPASSPHLPRRKSPSPATLA